ncbi:MAG: hypothetical protein ABR961_06890 [Thermoanaerobaculaceae bacterium]
MKHAVIVSMMVLVVVAAAAVAAPPPVAQTQAVKNLAQMPVEELQKLQPPPGAKIKMQLRSMPLQAMVSSGPDLVNHQGEYWTGPAYGSALGFAGANFPGWRGIWVFENRGQATAPGGWKVNVACEVMNISPGTPQYAFYAQRWCSYAEGVFTYSAPMPKGAMTPGNPPFVKTFTGYPLWPCSAGPNAPHPRMTVTVDYTNVVPEGPQGEANNVYQNDLCMTQ